MDTKNIQEEIMGNRKKQFSEFGIIPADILIPKPSNDLAKWAVVACDQYTSEPEYWQRVSSFVGDAPSCLRITFPECYLEDGDKEQRISDINATMNRYMQENIFDTYPECFILVARTTETGTRYGLMAALDLERYSYAPDSKTNIRATEGTILSRIPPRKEIRKNAPLELPHIMVLISDKYRAIIEPLAQKKAELKKLYDVSLMENGGRVEGYLIKDEADMEAVLKGFEALYKDLDPANPLLFAMGDGNHSLATAKNCWEDIKKTLTPEEAETHPARYSLVEIENIFDPALQFEPIHRVFFNTDVKTLVKKVEKLTGKVEIESTKNLDKALKLINTQISGHQRFALVENGLYSVITAANAVSSTSAGTIQKVIDSLTPEEGIKVDYIHGVDVTVKLAADKNVGIILPDVSKETFFDSIIKDRAFPRKTFSIGHAHEKRYYLEARRITK
jgi:Protein of unknown function (DUF1015).